MILVVTVLCCVWAVLGLAMLLNKPKRKRWVNGARNQGLPEPIARMVKAGKVKIISRGKDYCMMEKL